VSLLSGISQIHYLRTSPSYFASAGQFFFSLIRVVSEVPRASSQNSSPSLVQYLSIRLFDTPSFDLFHPFPFVPLLSLKSHTSKIPSNFYFGGIAPPFARSKSAPPRLQSLKGCVAPWPSSPRFPLPPCETRTSPRQHIADLSTSFRYHLVLLSRTENLGPLFSLSIFLGCLPYVSNVVV